MKLFPKLYKLNNETYDRVTCHPQQPLLSQAEQ